MAEDHYFVFDCPGQVELLTLHDSFQKVIQTITNKWSFRFPYFHHLPPLVHLRSAMLLT